MKADWVKELPLAVTVTDRDGTILEMNDRSAATFEKYGGMALVGTDVKAVHSERSCKIMEQIAASGTPNVYTIEKGGVKKMVYQTPWYENGEYAGLVEFSLALPAEIPHYVRK